LSRWNRSIYNCDPTENHLLLETVPPGSFVVNGTGIGKDSQRSPITAEGVFPENALVGEFNWEIGFVHQRVKHLAGVWSWRTAGATSYTDGHA
jgi:hypothetical protein